MSSRGTFAKYGYPTNKEYKTIKVTNSGAKILIGIDKNHSMPELSHSPNAVYVKLKKDNKTLHEIKIFNEFNYPVIEIGFHPEAKLNNGDRMTNILHYHTFNGIDRSNAYYMNDIIKEKYKIYLKEFGLYDKC